MPSFEKACQEEETHLIPLVNQSSSLSNTTGRQEHAMDVALHGPSGRTLLGPSVLTIGRAQSNQLVISDPKASSRHAEIHPAGQGYTIIDLGSMNGTFVNDQRLNSGTPRQLNQVATSNSNATATAQTSHNDVTATVRAQQNATATAFASVHLTATAQATSHYPPFTNPVLND